MGTLPDLGCQGSFLERGSMESDPGDRAGLGRWSKYKDGYGWGAAQERQGGKAARRQGMPKSREKLLTAQGWTSSVSHLTRIQLSQPQVSRGGATIPISHDRDRL